MSDTSRRTFMAAAGATAATGAVVAIGAASASAATRSADAAQESVVVLIEDHTSDELQIMVGEDEVVVHDRDLVTRILNAAGGR